MNSPESAAFVLLLIMTIIIFNSLISRDIYHWIPSTPKKLSLILLVWLIPVLGFFIANKFGKLGWFSKTKEKGGPSVVSGGFMEADAVFNPGARHTIEMREKQQADSQITQTYNTDEKS